jgi:hypothetical protein
MRREVASRSAGEGLVAAHTQSQMKVMITLQGLAVVVELIAGALVHYRLALNHGYSYRPWPS